MDVQYYRNSAVSDIDRLVSRINELEANIAKLASFGVINKTIAKYPAIAYDLKSLPLLEELKVAADEIKAKNEPLIKENLEVYDKIKTVFVAMGLSTTQYSKVGRKSVEVTADWLKSIQGMIPRADGSYEFERQYANKKKQLVENQEQERREKYNVVETQKRQEKQRQDNFDFAALCVKYARRSDESTDGLRLYLAGLCPYVNWLYSIDYGNYEDVSEVCKIAQNEKLSEKEIRERANQAILADYDRLIQMYF